MSSDEEGSGKGWKKNPIDGAPTLKFEAIRAADETREIPAPADQTLESRLYDEGEFKALIAASRGGEGLECSAESMTKMLSREELLRNAQADRSQHRISKPTVPLPKIVEKGQEGEGRTREFSWRGNGEECEGTLGSVEGGAGKMEYPARMRGDYQLPIPKDLAEELGLKVGDLLIVTIQKVSR